MVLSRVLNPLCPRISFTLENAGLQTAAFINNVAEK